MVAKVEGYRKTQLIFIINIVRDAFKFQLGLINFWNPLILSVSIVNHHQLFGHVTMTTDNKIMAKTFMENH